MECIYSFCFWRSTTTVAEHENRFNKLCNAGNNWFLLSTYLSNIHPHKTHRREHKVEYRRAATKDNGEDSGEDGEAEANVALEQQPHGLQDRHENAQVLLHKVGSVREGEELEKSRQSVPQTFKGGRKRHGIAACEWHGASPGAVLKGEKLGVTNMRQETENGKQKMSNSYTKMQS